MSFSPIFKTVGKWFRISAIESNQKNHKYVLLITFWFKAIEQSFAVVITTTYGQVIKSVAPA